MRVRNFDILTKDFMRDFLPNVNRAIFTLFQLISNMLGTRLEGVHSGFWLDGTLWKGVTAQGGLRYIGGKTVGGVGVREEGVQVDLDIYAS